MKRIHWIIMLGVLLVIFLASAAFIGGQLFRTQQETQAANNAQGLPRKLVTPAAGLPAEDPTARGDVQRRDGNSLFICDPTDTMTYNPDGSVNKNTACSPLVEVVIGHETQLL